MNMSSEEHEEYLVMLEEIEKEVDSWPKWKFLGSGSIGSIKKIKI